jgi:hypothetical protein
MMIIIIIVSDESWSNDDVSPDFLHMNQTQQSSFGLFQATLIAIHAAKTQQVSHIFSTGSNHSCCTTITRQGGQADTSSDTQYQAIAASAMSQIIFKLFTKNGFW